MTSSTPPPPLPLFSFSPLGLRSATQGTNPAGKTKKKKKTVKRTKPPTSTPTTRKILSSLKSFANHLSDEDALLQLHAQHPPSTHPAHLSASVRATRRDPAPPIPEERESQPNLNQQQQQQSQSHAHAYFIPWTVSSGCSYGLPLSYSSARADPSSRRVHRVFCEICGYWGKYRCFKCGARYCDLECKATHDDTRCERFWMQ